jgi:hypothetical protein
LANFAAAVETQVVYRNLLTLSDVPQSVDGVPLYMLIPVFVCVVVAGMVDTTCLQEDSTVNPYGSDCDISPIRSALA